MKICPTKVRGEADTARFWRRLAMKLVKLSVILASSHWPIRHELVSKP